MPAAGWISAPCYLVCVPLPLQILQSLLQCAEPLQAGETLQPSLHRRETLLQPRRQLRDESSVRGPIASIQPITCVISDLNTPMDADIVLTPCALLLVTDSHVTNVLLVLLLCFQLFRHVSSGGQRSPRGGGKRGEVVDVFDNKWPDTHLKHKHVLKYMKNNISFAKRVKPSDFFFYSAHSQVLPQFALDERLLCDPFVSQGVSLCSVTEKCTKFTLGIFKKLQRHFFIVHFISRFAAS